jgi:hypothetical protein
MKKREIKKSERNMIGNGVPQLRRSGFGTRSGHVGFVMDKVALRQAFSDSSVSPTNSHSTK